MGVMARLLVRAAAVLALTTLGAVTVAPAAWAHGDDETTEGYLLVQQALGHLAHDTGPTGIDLAMEKVDDALAAEDQDGMSVTDVEQAMTALEAGDADRARALLEGSIEQALSDLPPATGEQTGTRTVPSELPGRAGSLGGEDWGLLIASTLLMLLGLWLAARFRPADSTRVLRSRLGS